MAAQSRVYFCPGILKRTVGGASSGSAGRVETGVTGVAAAAESAAVPETGARRVGGPWKMEVSGT